MIVIRSPRVRSLLGRIIPFGAIPLAVALGALLPGRMHLFVSLAVAALSLGLFITGFEQRRTGSRRLVLTAVMTALCIAGRFIPLFKPVTALTILTGMYLGGEAGFLTGALAALISNFSFGQGPWTPFQMMAWGLIGLTAGGLHRPLKAHKWLLLLFGAAAGVAFSMVMDVWSVLWYDGSLRMELYAASLVAALPHTALYAMGNVVFLHLLAKPMGEKLTRMRVKYGV